MTEIKTSQHIQNSIESQWHCLDDESKEVVDSVSAFPYACAIQYTTDT